MILKMQNLIPKLMYFTIVTTIIVTTFSLSRFESAQAGSIDAKVALFVVNATGSDQDSMSIDCNSDNPTTSYDIVVTNKKDNAISEVAINYDIVVEFSDSLPSGITLTLGNRTINTTDENKIYKFSNVGSFDANVEKSNNHTITITGSNEVLTAYNGTLSFYIEATQIDQEVFKYELFKQK